MPTLPSHGSQSPELSVVTPFYNEEANVVSVLSELRDVLDGMGMTYELVAINDGSKDNTAPLLDQTQESWPQLRVIHMPVNQGQAPALWAGFQSASAPLVAVLDGDGQNDPSALPSMIAHLEETGTDMVAGVRAQRQDSWLRKKMSRTANSVRQFFLKDGVSDSGCALKVMRREVLSSFLPLRTLYSFMPALAVSAGYKVVEMPVPHRPRTGGTSNYGFVSMLWRPALDLLGIWWLGKRRFSLQNPAVPVVKPSSWATLWLFALPVMVFFMLGSRGLNEPDEGRYAEIAREMVVTGDWLVPHLNGFEHFQKPPVIYWATAVSFKLFGFNEYAARLPSALAACGTLILTFFLTRRLWGAERAHVACTLLLSMLGFFVSSRLLVPDTTMTFWIMASITALVMGRSRMFFVAMGLGFLTKGPMALVVPLSAALGQYFAGERRNHWPWIRGLALTLLIGISWFIVMAIQKPELFDYFLRYELLERFASTHHGRSKPWWFFAPVLVIALLPWTFAIPRLMRKAFQQIKNRSLTPRQGLLLGWVILPLIVLSLAGSKLPTYILPLLPGLAIGISSLWADPRQVWKFAGPITAAWVLTFSLASNFNDTLGKQASLRDISNILGSRLQVEPGEIFVCGTRAHGLEFYLGQTVSTTKTEADLVLPVSAEQKSRLFEDAVSCEKHFRTQHAYGVMTEKTFQRFFSHGNWEILKNEGDFVLIENKRRVVSS